MIPDELLVLLCCPETRQPLALAPAALIAKLEAERMEGRLVNQGGQRVEGRIDAGLLREDGAVFFPVREGIPVLIAEEAIRLAK
jgi:uncharacterized protein YbaR (Trm112 family)